MNKPPHGQPQIPYDDEFRRWPNAAAYRTDAATEEDR
jgi:hypothetical protein